MGRSDADRLHRLEPLSRVQMHRSGSGGRSDTAETRMNTTKMLFNADGGSTFA